MGKKCLRRTLAIVLVFAFGLSMDMIPSRKVYAKSNSSDLNPTIYTFDEDSDYILKRSLKQDASDISPVGTLHITGDIQSEGKQDKVEKINVSSSIVKISYKFNKKDLGSKDDEWHVIADGTKSINGMDLDGKVGKGTVLVQTSFDGKKWVKSREKRNCFSDNKQKIVYKTTGTQLLNGCYFRIIVAYEQEITSRSKKILFVNKNEKECRKIAEVYEFYAVNQKEKDSSVSSSDIEPSNQYGEDVIKEVSKKGFSPLKNKKDDSTAIESIGSFTINGYTRKQKDDEGNWIYLKNAGDQVTLWFTLNQNIDKFGKNGSLKIVDVKKGYDKDYDKDPAPSEFDMGRGTLFVSYRNPQNVFKTIPPYSNYLAACATTSANTRIELYETGDYKIALDYKITDTSKKVDKNSYYRMSFKFSIHNSNSMVFPFDLTTGSELKNQDITPNGFRIDFANSDDLSVNVSRTEISRNSAGRYIEDVRENKAAKDGETYTNSGVYKIQVKNPYTNQETSKIIYVGTDPFLEALSATGLSVEDLDYALTQGYTIQEGGKLKPPNHPVSDVEQKIEGALENREKNDP